MPGYASILAPSIASPLVLGLLAACGSAADDAKVTDPVDVDADTDTDTDTDTDSDTDVFSTGTTGDSSTPPCDTAADLGIPMAVDLSFHDEQELDLAGYRIWAGDIDRDGRAEGLVGAPSDIQNYSSGPRSAVYLLDDPAASGALAQRAALTLPGRAVLDYWGQEVVGLPAEELVVVGASYLAESDAAFYLFDARARVSSQAISGRPACSSRSMAFRTSLATVPAWVAAVLSASRARTVRAVQSPSLVACLSLTVRS